VSLRGTAMRHTRDLSVQTVRCNHYATMPQNDKFTTTSSAIGYLGDGARQRSLHAIQGHLSSKKIVRLLISG